MPSDLTLHSARWISLRQRRFTNRLGQERTWEFVTRTNTTGAVGVVALVPGTPRKLLLIRQFRPPLNAYSIEFPAGLVDSGESPAEAALRELAEETGLLGTIISEGPEAFSSPGLTDEAIRLIRVEVTGETPARPESDEDITVLHAPLEGLLEWLADRTAQGDRLDAKVYSFAQGLAFQMG